MDILIGLLIIAIGSFCQSSSYVPIKKVKEWSEAKKADGRKIRELTEEEKQSMKERREYIASITHEYKR